MKVCTDVVLLNILWHDTIPAAFKPDAPSFSFCGAPWSFAVSVRLDINVSNGTLNVLVCHQPTNWGK